MYQFLHRSGGVTKILLYPPDSLFWCVKCCDQCNEIVVNHFQGLKVFFNIRVRERLYNGHGNNVLLQRTWMPTRSNYVGTYMNLNLDFNINIWVYIHTYINIQIYICKHFKIPVYWYIRVCTFIYVFIFTIMYTVRNELILDRT